MQTLELDCEVCTSLAQFWLHWTRMGIQSCTCFLVNILFYMFGCLDINWVLRHQFMYRVTQIRFIGFWHSHLCTTLATWRRFLDSREQTLERCEQAMAWYETLLLILSTRSSCGFSGVTQLPHLSILLHVQWFNENKNLHMWILFRTLSECDLKRNYYVRDKE
jgi:hypothetical protein